MAVEVHQVQVLCGHVAVIPSQQSSRGHNRDCTWQVLLRSVRQSRVSCSLTQRGYPLLVARVGPAICSGYAATITSSESEVCHAFPDITSQHFLGIGLYLLIISDLTTYSSPLPVDALSLLAILFASPFTDVLAFVPVVYAAGQHH
jgi:hypothetical protein